MNTSVIRYRVADFLKRHAPFDVLPETELLDLASSGRVKFHESEEYVLNQGQAFGPFVWVIQQGRVDLVEESDGGERLRDVAGEGDLLGVERFFGHTSWMYSARTANDVLLYSIEARRFGELLERYPALHDYLAAHFWVADSAVSGRTSWLDADPPPLPFLRARTGAVPAGAVATRSTRGIVRQMLRTRSETVAVSDDAAVTAGDLALFCDRNPALLLREIREARSNDVLAPLVRQGTRMVLDGLARFPDVDDCCLLGEELVAAAAEPVLRFAENDAHDAGLEATPARACWMAFGALARGEVLRPELPAIGVVFDDSSPEAGAWFATVAGQMAAGFYACGMSDPGFVWPEGIHPCLPLSEWKRFYRETIQDPVSHDLFARRELFDIRALGGDESLVAELHCLISEELRQQGMVVPLLANDTLSHLPPMAFFRGLVLETDGTERKGFDIARIAIHPIAGAARVFALAGGDASTGTLARLASAGERFPKGAAVFRDAAQAFRIAFFHLATCGGSELEPAKLSRYDQRLLRTAFASILRLLEFTASTFAVPE